jgi:aminopeptidase N
MKGTCRWTLLPVCCLVLSLPALAEEPFSFDGAPGRLPKNAVPISYSVAITPEVDSMTIQGKESVLLQLRQATDTLSFNTVNETLSEVRLDGQPVKSVESQNDKEWTSVTLAKAASIGPHTLTFSYVGKIETQPRGLFAQHYALPGGAKGVMLSTQMEPADARRMFPCWDEPAFRATFQLTVTVPSKWATVSNMPVAKRVSRGALTTTTFQRSPKMPSYLIELSVGDLTRISAKQASVEFGVWTVRGQEQYGGTALANAQAILADYNDYFGYPYPLPKLDSIAIPGGFAGAMENWGAITYNDQLLLVMPASTLNDRQNVFSTEAHEMAHQWNGDLVTMGWWDDLWLNESFASWMAARETALRHPEWNWLESEDASRETAMGADARAGSHAIQRHITNELEANNAFDPVITYNKGEAILRMFEAFLGEDTFRNGIRQYIKARVFSNATTGDLWSALNGVSGDRNVGQIAAGWTEQAGFPLVTQTATCDSKGERTIKLTQSRFLLQGSDPNRSHWSIPLQVRVGADSTPKSVLLTQEGQTLPAGRCDEPLSLNANVIGFYRVSYDAATLETNAKSFAQLPAGDRIALLDDQWALVGSGKQDLPSYLVLARSMGHDLDVRAWEQVEQALQTIEYDEGGTPGHDAFRAYARSLIKPAFDQLGWNAKPGEVPNLQKLRRAVLEDLGLWGDPGVIVEARKRLDAFIQDHSSLSPDDQVPVLNIVARNANSATFEKLHTLAKSAKDGAELHRYYAALMLVSDESLAERAAQIALSTEIPPQADADRIEFVVMLARQHQKLVWTTFCDHADTLLASHEPFGPYIIAEFTPQIFWSGIPLEQIDAWVRAHVPSEMSAEVERGLESARFKLAEKQRLVPAADSYLKTGASR